MAEEKEEIQRAKMLAQSLKDQISSGNYLGILNSVVVKPPNCKDADIHKDIGSSVISAISKLKKTSMDACLKKMDAKDRDIVLQYVLYGFQTMPQSSTEFLNWHQAIVKLDGIGAIVRAATNIKRNILVSANPMTE